MGVAFASGVLVSGMFADGGFGDKRAGSLAGPMGLLLVLALAAATIFLIRNMNARLRRLPERFPTEPAPKQPPAKFPSENLPSESQDLESTSKTVNNT